MTTINSIWLLNPILSNDVIENVIFPKLSLPELGTCSRVCKVWREMAKKHINAFSHEKAFGSKQWHTYFGAYLRNVPRLPSNISEILNSTCHFWPDKKVHETHVLVLIPETVNGQPLNLKVLGELVQKPLQGHPTKYNYFNLGECVDKSPQSHWALLTRTVIEGSRNKTYIEEHAVLSHYTQPKQIPYVIPNVLDAVVCNFIEYVRSETWLYSKNPCTYTWCQEKYSANLNLIVGGGSGPDLIVSSIILLDKDDSFGVGALRKL